MEGSPQPEEHHQAFLALVSCCRRIDNGDQGTWTRLARDEALLRTVLSLANQHGVIGLALASFERQGVVANLPGRQSVEMAELLKRFRRRAMVFEVERNRILSALRAGEVGDPVVLKGAALASMHFREPVERFYGDIDLLLPAEQVEDAARALTPLGYVNPFSQTAVEGYRSHHFHLRVANGKGGIVELHWGLERPDIPFRLDAASFLAQSVRWKNGKVELRVPRPEHMLLHIVLQNVQEAFTRLTRLVDIDRVVAASPDMDWDLAVGQARSGNLGAATALSLQLARRVLGTPVPRSAVVGACPSRWARGHLALLRPAAAMARLGEKPSRAAEELLRLWLLPPRERRHTFVKLLSPRSEDPLRWIWEGGASPEDSRRSVGWSLRNASRVVGRQLGAYAGGLGRWTTPAGRSELRFWRDAG